MSAPRIDTQMTQHVARSLVSGEFATAARRPVSFNRDTLEIQEGPKKENTQTQREVATKEESSFCGTVGWVLSRPFACVAYCVTALYNLVCCNEEKTEDNVTGPASKKTAQVEEETETGEASATEETETETPSFKPQTDLQREIFKRKGTDLTGLWDAQGSSEKARGTTIGWRLAQADRKDGASVARKDFNLHKYLDERFGDDQISKEEFYVRIEQQRVALDLVSKFADENKPLKLDGKKPEDQKRLVREAAEKFRKLAKGRNKAFGEQAQRLMKDAACVMHGGRVSCFVDAKTSNYRTILRADAGRVQWADADEEEHTVAPFGKVQAEAFKRVSEYGGCLLPNDKARAAIAEFMNEVEHARETYGQVSGDDLREAVANLASRSPQALALLETVVGNFFGGNTNGRTKIEKATREFDIQHIVHCANMIDQFDNHGRVAIPPRAEDASAALRRDADDLLRRVLGDAAHGAPAARPRTPVAADSAAALTSSVASSF